MARASSCQLSTSNPNECSEYDRQYVMAVMMGLQASATFGLQYFGTFSSRCLRRLPLCGVRFSDAPRVVTIGSAPTVALSDSRSHGQAFKRTLARERSHIHLLVGAQPPSNLLFILAAATAVGVLLLPVSPPCSLMSTVIVIMYLLPIATTINTWPPFLSSSTSNAATMAIRIVSNK